MFTYMAGKEPGEAIRILLVDDEPEGRRATKWFLEHYGYVVEDVYTATEAKARFEPGRHQLVITDNSMPDMTGVELARHIKTVSPSTPVVLYTGSANVDTEFLDDVIQKPADLRTFREVIERALGKQEVR